LVYLLIVKLFLSLPDLPIETLEIPGRITGFSGPPIEILPMFGRRFGGAAGPPIYI